MGYEDDRIRSKNHVMNEALDTIEAYKIEGLDKQGTIDRTNSQLSNPTNTKIRNNILHMILDIMGRTNENGTNS